jgi:hypothetical protein
VFEASWAEGNLGVREPPSDAKARERADPNTLMSHIAGTSPNEVTLDAAFALRLFAWTIVPLLSVAAAQYPEVANVLFAVFGPFARALK